MRYAGGGRRTEGPVRVEPGEQDSDAGRERSRQESEDRVEPEVVSAGHDDIRHQQRISEEGGSDRAGADQHGQRPGEDHREADVHRRHSGERVEEGITGMREERVVAGDGARRIKPQLREESRRGRWEECVTDHRDHHGGEHGVAHEAVAPPIAEVEDRQHQAAALEVQVRVPPAGHLGRPSRVDRPVLDSRLDQQSERTLGADQVPCM
jgi:hypothetical protein